MFKKKRTGVFILIALLLSAALGAVGYIRTRYTIQTVYVEGNVHYTEDEIKAIVMDGFLGDNSLYLSLKYKNKGIEGIPFVDVVDVDILSPDTVKIIVYEKTLTGCVRYLDTYVYFDRDGYVVESSNVKTVGVPQIMGLQFDHIITGEKLPVGDETIFANILDITKLLQKYKLVSDRIYFNKSGAITVYFGDIRVLLGNDSATLEDKLMLLQELLPNLEGKKGVLQMQTFDADSGKYIFKPEE
mgnify:CR=1 FL=1